MIFSSLTLTGDNIPKPITLARQDDFPSCQFDFTRSIYRDRPDWEPSPRPEHGHLSLRLGKRIAGGRSAVVYAAEILTVSKPGGILPSDPLPSERELCVKIARRNRCRTLAREAWFCDQLSLGQLQGIITPRTYGFFTADVSHGHHTFPLWDSKDFELKISDEDSQDDPTRDDPLPDDESLDEARCRKSPGARGRSPWCQWRPDPDSPLLAVIVMSRGGATYTRKDDADQHNQTDIRAILDDLSDNYMWHGDLRPNNLVRAPASTLACSKHSCVHKWNIIDFAWTTADDTDGDIDTKLRTIHNLQLVCYRNHYFWTGSST